jgi:GNAT superfamily N-acetyltransferase
MKHRPRRRSVDGLCPSDESEHMTTTPRPAEQLDGNGFAAERVEAEWFFDWIDGAPEPAKMMLATNATRLHGGGVATSMANDPVAYWSKSLGFERPVDRSTIAEIVDFYLTNGTPSAAIQIAPALLPVDWSDICAEFGLSRGSTWIKLAGSTNIPLEIPGGLTVGVVAAGDLEEWAEVVFRGFGMPPAPLSSIAVESARRGAIRPFGAWVGTSLVAGASLAIVDGVGALLGAATLAEYRGRGAQTALIAIRAQAARRAGVKRLTAETGRPAATGGNPSFNNLTRSGLEPLYERVNWEWTNPTATPTPAAL